MDSRERESFERELNDFTKWYALAFQRFLNSGDERYCDHPNSLFDGPACEAHLFCLRADEIYPDELFEQILTNYRRLLRGKSLLQLSIRQLSYTGRSVRHNLSLIHI